MKKVTKFFVLALCLLLFAVPVSAKTKAKAKPYGVKYAWSAYAYTDGWAQDRLNQSPVDLDGRMTAGEFGVGITVYVIDTGVGSSDCNGHGTFIANSIVGKEYGIAKAAKIISVKVLDCSGLGTTQGVIDGVNWVYANADPETSVVNMSLGGPADAGFDAAVNRLAVRMPVVVAAGNGGTDACKTSPARASKAITVGAIMPMNFRPFFSNWGKCVDIWAPGDSVDGIGKDGERVNLSGTSMAAGLVSASIAYLADRDDTTTMAAALTMFKESSNRPVVFGNSPRPRPYVLWLREQKGGWLRTDSPSVLP